MPANKKEGLIFGVMMCFGMVCVMSIYNAIINGAIHDFSLVTAFEMVIGFIVALLLDLLLVGPLPKRLHSACRSTSLRNYMSSLPCRRVW